MRLAVYGAGAIGSWFGAALVKGGQDVTLIGRPDHVDAINARGLTIEDLVTGTTQVVKFAHPALPKLPQGEPFDAILVTTKTHDLAAAADALAPLLDTTPVCIFQNGIGNEDIIREKCPAAQILRALTSHGVIYKRPGHVIHAGIGNTFIGIDMPALHASPISGTRKDRFERILNDAKGGKTAKELGGELAALRSQLSKENPLDPVLFELSMEAGRLKSCQKEWLDTAELEQIIAKLKHLAEKKAPQSNDHLSELAKALAIAWEAAGIPVQFVPDIAKRVWEKVFVNVGINPFAAIARVPNGELLKDPQMRAAMEGAVEEAVAVAWEKKVDLSGIDPVGAMFDVAEKTVNNRNSMLQDIEKGKPTEIMFLNGKIAEWGAELHVPTPINSTLTALVKLLERQIIKK